jgi:hypothetical protein
MINFLVAHPPTGDMSVTSGSICACLCSSEILENQGATHFGFDILKSMEIYCLVPLSCVHVHTLMTSNMGTFFFFFFLSLRLFLADEDVDGHVGLHGVHQKNSHSDYVFSNRWRLSILVWVFYHNLHWDTY